MAEKMRESIDKEHSDVPAEAEIDRDACEAMLDEAIEESFPASDPPAVTLPHLHRKD